MKAASGAPSPGRQSASTHRDLAEEVKRGRFREDLFFRIAVFEIEVPPLRERGEDVLLLARKFLADAAEAAGRPPVELSPEAAEARARSMNRLRLRNPPCAARRFRIRRWSEPAVRS